MSSTPTPALEIDERGQNIQEDMEKRHDEINHLFGFIKHKGHVSKRSLEDRSEAVRSLYRPYSELTASSPTSITGGNIIWAITGGASLWLFYMVLSGVLFVTYVGRHHARVALDLARYCFWPFNKFIARTHISEHTALLQGRDHADTFTIIRRPAGRIACILWWIFWPIICGPIHLIMMSLMWEGIVTIPMAKAQYRILRLCSDPLSLKITPHSQASSEILLFIPNATNRYFFKFSAFGMNVVILNMIPFIIFAIFLGFLPEDTRNQQSILILVSCFCSIVPLSYYIGKAISMLSCQSTFTFGAFLNATFGSIIELVLYFGALKAGMNDVVHSSVTGSILGTLILLPGLSMVFGGIKYQEQRFNSKSATVSGLLLLISIGAAFIPTLFYKQHAPFDISCDFCSTSVTHVMSCVGCQDTLQLGGPSYQSFLVVQNIIAVLMPIPYVVGLIFTLRTHKHLFESEGGHDVEYQWGRTPCVIILLICTSIFALISETLVDVLQPALTQMGLSTTFAGVCLIGLVPNIAEFVNAIQFSLQNNVGLSVEIGSSAAMQISLVQIPALVLISKIVSPSSTGFVMIFNEMDLATVFIAVMVFTFMSTEGRSNYFYGTGLVVLYFIMVAAFFALPPN